MGSTTGFALTGVAATELLAKISLDTCDVTLGVTGTVGVSTVGTSTFTSLVTTGLGGTIGTY